jgi:hypothetical protein
MNTDIETLFADQPEIAAIGRNRIKAIARRCLYIDTLDEKGRTEEEDFYNLHIFMLTEALSYAWHNGYYEGLGMSLPVEVRS